MDSLNNFYMYFPGGGYRREKWPSDDYPERYQKIVSDLDRLIEVDGMDVETYKRERGAER